MNDREGERERGTEREKGRRCITGIPEKPVRQGNHLFGAFSGSQLESLTESLKKKKEYPSRVQVISHHQILMSNTCESVSVGGTAA